eukprot:g992.t1
MAQGFAFAEGSSSSGPAPTRPKTSHAAQQGPDKLTTATGPSAKASLTVKKSKLPAFLLLLLFTVLWAYHYYRYQSCVSLNGLYQAFVNFATTFLVQDRLLYKYADQLEQLHRTRVGPPPGRVDQGQRLAQQFGAASPDRIEFLGIILIGFVIVIVCLLDAAVAPCAVLYGVIWSPCLVRELPLLAVPCLLRQLRGIYLAWGELTYYPFTPELGSLQVLYWKPARASRRMLAYVQTIDYGIVFGGALHLYFFLISSMSTDPSASAERPRPRDETSLPAILLQGLARAVLLALAWSLHKVVCVWRRGTDNEFRWVAREGAWILVCYLLYWVTFEEAARGRAAQLFPGR